MLHDIDSYNKAQLQPKIAVRMNPDFPTTRKTPNKGKKAERKSAGVMVIVEIGRVEKYDLINNLVQAQAGITFRPYC